VRAAAGGAVQVDPIKPTLKALGLRPLKVKYNDLLSKFAFKYNLRRYSLECCQCLEIFKARGVKAGAAPDDARHIIDTHFEPSFLKSIGVL